MKLFQRVRRNLLRSRPVTAGIAFSKATTFPGFKNKSLFEVFVATRSRILNEGMIERASAISYNFAMAFPPAIIFLFTLIPYIPINKSFINEIYGLIISIVPGPKNYTAIINFLNDFLTHPRNDLLSIGFLLSLFFSSNAIMGLMRAFDKNLPGFTKRKGFAKRLAALRITLVLFLFFIVCIAVLAARVAVLKWLGIENNLVVSLIASLRWVLVIVLFFVINSYLYRAVPSIEKKWKFINPGAVLSTVLMVLCVLGFSWWVGNFAAYNKLYGSISVIIILMVLIYLNSLVLLIGYELNVSIDALTKNTNPSPNRDMQRDEGVQPG